MAHKGKAGMLTWLRLGFDNHFVLLLQCWEVQNEAG